MKSGLIRNQHVFLKLVVFTIGISTSFEVSHRQLAAQSLLLFLYLLADLRLYASFLFAVRKLLTWFAAYWIFALIFRVEFLQSLMFSFKIIYLILLTVAVWASTDKARLWAELNSLRGVAGLKPMFSYFLATYLFLKEYLNIYRIQGTPSGIYDAIEHAIETGKRLHQQSSLIGAKVNRLMQMDAQKPAMCIRANLYGLLFLSLLGIVYSI